MLRQHSTRNCVCVGYPTQNKLRQHKINMPNANPTFLFSTLSHIPLAHFWAHAGVHTGAHAGLAGVHIGSRGFVLGCIVQMGFRSGGI